MKSRIFIAILVLALLVGGLFLPVQSGLRDHAEPEINPITAFTDVQAKEKEAEKAPEETEESELVPSDIISGLTEAEQSAYAWAAVHSDPETLLMTPSHIKKFDAALLEASQEVDILEGSKIKAKKVRSMIEKDLEDFFALDGISLNESEQKFLAANANVTGFYQDMRYGIVTDIVSLRRIPTDAAIRNKQGEDLAEGSSLACPCPVWVLHTSTDGSWYYVQTALERGWIHAQAVGITKSKEAWRSYASPEKVVVVTDPQITLEKTNLAMGSVLSCLEENGDSYTVLLPMRKEKGSLDATEVIIDRENCNLDYPDYTWVHLFKYLYRFMDQPQPLSNEAMICQVYSVFNIHLPQDLIGNFDSLGEVTDLTDLLEDEVNKALAGASGPALILDADGLSVLLGARDGRIWKFQYIDGEIVESAVNEPQKFVVIGG